MSEYSFCLHSLLCFLLLFIPTEQILTQETYTHDVKVWSVIGSLNQRDKSVFSFKIKAEVPVYRVIKTKNAVNCLISQWQAAICNIKERSLCQRMPSFCFDLCTQKAGWLFCFFVRSASAGQTKCSDRSCLSKELNQRANNSINWCLNR